MLNSLWKWKQHGGLFQVSTSHAALDHSTGDFSEMFRIILEIRLSIERVKYTKLQVVSSYAGRGHGS